jgi:pyridoxamine 5'-phosphate oxidase
VVYGPARNGAGIDKAATVERAAGNCSDEEQDVSEFDGATRDQRTAAPAGDFTAAVEPFALFGAWFADAERHEINDHNAMALATADTGGLPNVRMVLLKGLDAADEPARGFVFYTNLDSAKGRELGANMQAALLFHWKSLRRQVRVRGVVSRVGDAEADAYYASRPRGSRLGAWASDQSRPLESRFALEKKVALVTARYPIGEIPRPAHWSGFRVTPLEMEFWHDRPFRLHDRVVFRRDNANGSWTRTRLYP